MANKQMHHLKVGDNIFEIVDSVARSGISGAPSIVSLSSAMIDTSKLYLYIGSETGYTSGDWYYYNGTSWVSGGQYGDMQLDTSLTASGMAADAKSVGDRFNSFANTATAGQAPIADGAGGWTWGDVETGDSVPTAVRQAIATLFSKGVYTETGLADEVAVIQSWATEVTDITLNRTSLSFGSVQAVILQATTVPSGVSVIWSTSDASVATVNNGVVTPVGNGTCTITASAGSKRATCAVSVSAFASLTGISAVYTQSGTVYDTDSLDDLKSDLVVTASYDNGTTQTVTDYTLSGTLTEGTSTIIVAYSGFTATFTVNVSANVIDSHAFSYINWESGYIDNTGAFVSDSSKALFDEFLPAEYGEVYQIRSSNTLYMSEYDANKAFLTNVSASKFVTVSNSATKYVKLGVPDSIKSGNNAFDRMEKVTNSDLLTLDNTNLDTSGNEKSESGKKCTDFIDISDYGLTYLSLITTNGGIALCLYDANETFISRHAIGSANTSLTVPDNAKYIRVACTVGESYAQYCNLLIWG